MAGQNVVKHYLRLNLQNEQHKRIQTVLENLNKDIHKSENQFIIKAIDFYIQSFEDDDIMDRIQERKKPEYVTAGDLAQMRREIENGMKDELIRLLGLAALGSMAPRGGADRQEEDNLYAAEAANRWG